MSARREAANALHQFVCGGDVIGSVKQATLELGGQKQLEAAIKAGWLRRITYIEWTVDGRYLSGQETDLAEYMAERLTVWPEKRHG